MTFLKHFKDEEIHKITGPVFDSSHEQVAQAAQLDGVRQVREWGDELCPHDYRVFPNRRKRACDKCWDEMRKEVEK